MFKARIDSNIICFSKISEEQIKSVGSIAKEIGLNQNRKDKL